MCWVRNRPPVPIVSWRCPLQRVNPLQPSIRSAGQSCFSLLLCCCSSSGCSVWLLWFPSLSWWFILFSWMVSLMNGTFISSCKVWLVTCRGAFMFIRSIFDRKEQMILIDDAVLRRYGYSVLVFTRYCWRTQFHRGHHNQTKICCLENVAMGFLHMDWHSAAFSENFLSVWYRGLFPRR
jgi:hypothetical protein